MDTNETNEPVGSDDVTSSPDTSNDIAQPAETEEVVDGDNSEEAGEATELLAGKYKTPEELAKAYKELEGKLGETGQKAELANLIEKRTGMNYQQIKEALAQQEQVQQIQLQQDNPVEYLMQKQEQLENQIAFQNEEKELDKFLSSEEGKPYADFKDKLLDMGLNYKRDMPYADIAKEYFGQSRAQGQQDAYKKIDNKKKTQATGVSMEGKKGKVGYDSLKDLPLSERLRTFENLMQ